MPARLLRRFPPACALAAAVAIPAIAGATDGPDVVVVEVDDDDGDNAEVVETVEVVHEDDDHHHHVTEQPWIGFHLGAVNTPLNPGGNVRPGKRVTSNPFKACLDPFSERYCSAMRGFDMRVQYFETTDAWHYPRWVGYFRTGYTAGRAQFDPADREGYVPGEATSLSYYAVPLFFGGSVYLFEKFPVRPYGGLGFGFDVVKLQYRRHEDRSLLDASARIGFELHAGLEARISNVVAITAEVQQLWSARRKITGVPDFSNQGLTVMTGIAISIPTRQSRQRRHHHGHRHKVVTKTKRTPAKAPPVAAPPVVVTPAPAPAPAPSPVNVEVNQTVNAAPTADATAPAAAETAADATEAAEAAEAAEARPQSSAVFQKSND